MSSSSSIFVLKPIIDLLHEEVVGYINQIKQLKERIAELEKEKNTSCDLKPIKIEPVESVIKEKKPRPKIVMAPVVINDEDFAKEAETFVEPVNEVVEEKVVTVVNNEKTKKEYQQEYQRQYRKLKKEKQQAQQIIS